MPAATAATRALLGLAGLLLVQARRAAARDYLPNEPDPPTRARVEPGGTVTPLAHAVLDRPAPPGTVRLVALGDSTVRGVGADGLEGRAPVELGRRVAARTGRDVEVVGLGVSGARMAQVRRLQAPRVRALAPDLVLVLAGANDATHATPPRRFEADLDATLAELVEAVGRDRVLVAGIGRFSGVGALDRPLRDVADRYAAVLRRRQRRAVDAHGVRWLDLSTAASPRYRDRPETMSSDDFHPSGVGYRLWAEALEPHAVEAIVPRSVAG